MSPLAELLYDNSDELYDFSLTPDEVRRTWNAAVTTINEDGRDTLSSYLVAFRGRLDLLDKRIATLEDEVSFPAQYDELRRLAARVWEQRQTEPQNDQDGNGWVSVTSESLEALVEAISHEQGLEEELEGIRRRRKLLAGYIEVINCILFEDIVLDRRRRWGSLEQRDPLEGLTGRVRDYVETFVDKVLRATPSSTRPPSLIEVEGIVTRGRPNPDLSMLWKFVASSSVKADGTHPTWNTVRDRFANAGDPNGDGMLFHANEPIEVVL